jgi:DNA-binding NarL/FixJ family response regulator
MKILVIDDHVLIRQAMQGVLKKLRRDAVVLEAANYKQAKQILAGNEDIALVLLDLTLPDRDGFSVLSELRENYPAISVVVLSAVQDAANVRKALDLGALGYITKSAEGDVMVNALRLVMSGGVYIPPELLAREGVPTAPARLREDDKSVSPAAGGLLTDRQLEVLALLMHGKSNKAICRALHLTEQTVKTHVSAILKALNVSNRTEAVIAANQLGLKLPEIAEQ